MKFVHGAVFVTARHAIFVTFETLDDRKVPETKQLLM